MKKTLNFSDFKKQIEKGNLASLYLFVGEEELAKKEALEILIQKLIPRGLESFNLNYPDAEKTEISDLATLASTVPAGSDRRLVVVKYGENFKSSHRQGLIDFFPKIPRTTCLILLFSGLSEKDKLYTAGLNSGVIVNFADPKGVSLSKWITEQFALRHKKIDPGSVEFLKEMAGGNLNLLSREIEKITTHAGEKERIEKEELEKVAFATQRWNVYQLADQIVLKDTKKSLRTLQEILLYGEAHSTVNYIISDHFMTLLRTKSCPKKDRAGLIEYLNLGRKAFLAAKYQEQAGRFSPRQLEKAVEYLYQTELDFRSNLSSPKIILEVLIYNLTHL